MLRKVRCMPYHRLPVRGETVIICFNRSLSLYLLESVPIRRKIDVRNKNDRLCIVGSHQHEIAGLKR